MRELERKSHDQDSDPVLSLARRIPALPAQTSLTIDALVPLVAKIVFPERFAQNHLKMTDKSDVLHLCHAISAGASGYITSDFKVLSARDDLMDQFKLDVIALSEFVDLIDWPAEIRAEPAKRAKSFRIERPTQNEIKEFLERERLSIDAFMSDNLRDVQMSSVRDDDGIIGVSLLRPAPAIDSASRIIIYVQQEHPFSSTIADFLLSEVVRRCVHSAPCRILMLDVSSQPITRRVALSQGFQPSDGSQTMTKVALGRPVNEERWGRTRLAVERLLGLELQKSSPRYNQPTIGIIDPTTSVKTSVTLFELETLLSPTILALPQRQAVIVPITRAFAADLLGTDNQYTLLEVPEAQFLSRRTYFNVTRASRAMIRAAVIVFYESAKNKGRGAVVALGRILDVTSVSVDSVPELMQRGAVVEKPAILTKSSRLLATTFDNLIPLPRPIPMASLRQIGCVTRANFITATPISDVHLN